MIRVTEYEPLSGGKIRVCLDNGVQLVLYKGEAKQMQLTADSCIPEEDYRILLEEIVGKRAKKRAMHLLEKMDRTKQQLREKLSASYPPECVEIAVEYVSRFHYLDDYRYACNYIYYRRERYSRRQLQMKLSAKGVSPGLIAQALEEFYTADESEQIRRLLVKRQYTPGCDRQMYAKTYQYLLRKGFGSGEILRTMRDFSPICEDDSVFSQ
ncbi:MAG: RecX family transcriptional regulator [Roseburia sp.]|nr:RecX family transcriptional regulator [Roseburia sp.]MCM1430528.1 RecX family transcriptional regulator [Muribaculaceae bacterium]